MSAAACGGGCGAGHHRRAPEGARLPPGALRPQARTISQAAVCCARLASSPRGFFPLAQAGGDGPRCGRGRATLPTAHLVRSRTAGRTGVGLLRRVMLRTAPAGAHRSADGSVGTDGSGGAGEVDVQVDLITRFHDATAGLEALAMEVLAAHPQARPGPPVPPASSIPSVPSAPSVPLAPSVPSVPSASSVPSAPSAPSVIMPRRGLSWPVAQLARHREGFARAPLGRPLLTGALRQACGGG